MATRSGRDSSVVVELLLRNDGLHGFTFYATQTFDYSCFTLHDAGIMDRHFTVAVFVVYQDKTLLHWHKKLEVWLPVGGHVDPNESLCEAAIREVREESGLDVELYRMHPPLMENERHIQNLISPIHMQNERIGDGHEHLDAIYYARASSHELRPMEGETMKIGWYTEEELETLPLLPDVKLFAKEALALLRR